MGEKVLPLSGFGLDGKPLTIEYAEIGRPVVLYFITPYGHFVRQNEARFAAVVRHARNTHAFFIVSGRDDRLVEYIDLMRPQWQDAQVTVIGSITEQMGRSIRMGGYPRTLVVSTNGTVVLCAEGTYQGSEGKKIESYFNLKMPQLP